MYLLTVDCFVSSDDIPDEDESGLYKFYRNDISKANNVLDLLKLTFLRRLSNNMFRLCICDSLSEKCRYCKSRIPEITYTRNGRWFATGEQLKQIRESETEFEWDLSNKENYLFEIDIFNVNQTGCEEIVRLSDFDTTLFAMYRESFAKKWTDVIPIFKHTITSIDDPTVQSFLLNI